MAFNRVNTPGQLVAQHVSCRYAHYQRHLTINSFQGTPPSFPAPSSLVFVDNRGLTPWNYPGSLEVTPTTTGLDGRLTVIQSQQIRSRMFFLERSVFDLVEAHPYLALTDPKLLGWYLSLTVQDRNIILNEGGFHRFLERHPALELTTHHVYVKNVPYPCPVMLQDQQLNEPEQLVGVITNPEGLENCSLDMELDQYFQKKNHEENPGISSQSANITAKFPQAKTLMSEQSVVKDNISEYCSCDSVASDDIDGSSESPVALVPGFSGHPEPVDDRNISFKSTLEEDTSILVCLDSKGTVVYQKDGQSALAAADAREINKPEGTRCPPEKACMPMSGVSSCNATIGPNLVQRSSASTQTKAEATETRDKNATSELNSSELDLVFKAFTKIKKNQKECLERISSLASSLRIGCNCGQRAQRSELNLLALQYIVCQQHCWRLYYTCGEGLVSIPGEPTEQRSTCPPANLSSVLQKLEADYSEMKDLIMKGIPLDQLKPLSVNTERITPGADYTPAQMTVKMLKDQPLVDQQKSDVSETENRSSSSNQRIPQCQQEAKTQRHSAKEVKSKSKGAETAIVEDKVSEKEFHKAVARKTEELNTSETWFDAKEELNQPETIKEKPHSTNRSNNGKDKVEEEEVQCSVLCLTNPPKDVTERDMKLWFKKYCASDVKITMLEKDLRVALVFMPNTQNAEAALKELKGFDANIQTIQVKKCKLSDDGNNEKPEEPKSTEHGNIYMKSTYASSASSSDTRMKVVSTVPRANATFVPQHFGTMGSFDILMSELKKLHPSVKRERIVEALMELRAEHQGRLIGLPLRKIREMASEVLSKSEMDKKGTSHK